MSEDDGGEKATARSAGRRRSLILVLLLLFAYGFFVQVPAWNEFSRYDLVRALVEQGTTRIDSFHENTQDKSFRDGHYYSDKAPGTAFIGVPAYAVVNAAARASGQDAPDTNAAIAALAFVASGILTALLALLLFRFLGPAVGDAWALVIAVGYGLGSIAFAFATMLFGHAASACFLFATFFALWRARRTDGRASWAVLAGFLAGWAVLADVSSGLGLLVLGLYALLAGGSVGRWGPRLLARVDIRTPVLMVLGGLAPAALLLGYNWVSFGSPFSLGYTNLANSGFAEAMGKGILGATIPKPEVLVELLVGPRGLLRFAPWFALAPVGLLAARRRELRAEVLVAGAIVVTFLLFNAGYYLPFGGWTPGPRFLLPALPFAAVLVGVAPLAVPAGRVRRAMQALIAVLVCVSVALMLVATTTMPNAPELYGDPLLELWIPRLVGGYLADTIAWLRWGSAGLEPLVILAVGVVLGLVGLAATFRRGPAATQTSAGIAILLGVFTLAFAFPFPSPGPVIAATPDPAAAPSFAVRSIGATRFRSGGTDELVILAQIENTGPAVDGTRVLFQVDTAGGEKAWAAWYGDVAWLPGQRRTMTVTWDTSEVAPGEYRASAEVLDGTTEEPLGGAKRPDPVRLDP